MKRGLTLCAVVVAAAVPATAHAEHSADACLQLDSGLLRVDGADREGGLLLLVTVAARACAVDDLSVKVLLPDGSHHQRQVARLAAGSRKFWRVAVPSPAEDVGVVLAYRHKTRTRGIQQVIQAGFSDEASDPSVGTLILSGLGLLATLLAVVITERYARQRQRRADAREWNKTLHEKYEQPYRDFLSAWGQSGNVAVLTNAFEQLQAQAFVPPSLESEYKRALRKMQAAGSDVARAKVAAKLGHEFSKVLTRPTGFIEASGWRARRRRASS